MKSRVTILYTAGGFGKSEKKNSWSCDVCLIAVPPPSSHGFIMKRTKLEFFVKRSFHMPVEEFMRQKVEDDGCFDKEIADTLNVSIPTVRMLRKQYGLKRADPFFRQFESTYGPAAVRRFKAIIEDSSSSLAEVGRQFGFTREYARQIYNKIYGVPYTETYKKKILLRRSKTDLLKFPSNWYKNIRTVKDKMTRMGLDPTMLIEAKSYVLLTNTNLRVAVLHKSKLRQIRNKKYFPIHMVSKHMQKCDFFILSYRNNGDNGYFIIPHAFMPKKGSMILVSSDNASCKYTRFKNAWHLLSTR